MKLRKNDAASIAGTYSISGVSEGELNIFPAGTLHPATTREAAAMKKALSTSAADTIPPRRAFSSDENFNNGWSANAVARPEITRKTSCTSTKLPNSSSGRTRMTSQTYPTP